MIDFTHSLLFVLAICLCFSCKTPQNTNTIQPEPLPENVIPNELLVQCSRDMSAELSKKHESYGLSVKKTVSKRMNIFLFEYDVTRIDPRAMLKIIQEEAGVTTAEFNKKVGLRED